MIHALIVKLDLVAVSFMRDMVVPLLLRIAILAKTRLKMMVA